MQVGDNIRWDPPDSDNLIERYLAGESLKSLAESHGVTRPVIGRVLHEHGIAIRSSAEANQLMMSKRTPEENARNSEAAHAAVRGTRRPPEFAELLANNRHGKPTGNPAEMLYAEWLRDLHPVHQFAVGPYNCDLMIEPVAVEINGGHWHGSGRHAARAVARAQHILDQGYNVVFVWISLRTGGCRVESANYIRSVFEFASRPPSLRGKYWVVWGDGQVVPVSGYDLDELTRVPPRGASQH